MNQVNNEIEELLNFNPIISSLYHNARVHCILISDIDGYIFHFNETFQFSFGYTIRDLLGKHVRVLFTQEDRERLLPEQEIEQVKIQKFARDRNYVVHKDGTSIWSDGESILTTDTRGKSFIFKIIKNIHDQKVQELFLRSEKEFSEKLIGSISNGLVVIDHNGKILKVNKCFYDITGAKAFEGSNLYELNVSLFSAVDFVKALQSAIEEKVPKNFELRFSKTENETRIVSIEIKLLEEAIDSKVLILLTDVTSDRTAAEKLRQSEQRYRNLIAEAPVATAVYVGEEMRIQYANEAMLRMYGKGSYVIGKPFQEALPELEGQPFYDLLLQVYKTGEIYWAKADRADLIIDSETYSSYYNFSYKPLRNETGEIYGILVMAVDVGDQVKMQKELQESEGNLQTIFRQAPVGLCLVEGHKAIVKVVNDIFLELIGKPRQKVEGIGYWDALPEIRHIYAPIMQKVFDTALRYQGVEHPVPLIRNGKSEIVYISFVYEPLVSEDGNVNRIMIVAMDVTPQVEARLKIEHIVAERTKDLAQSKERLERSNAELAQFAYVASHDLQEPLRKIQIFGSYLQGSASGKLDNKEMLFLQKILHSTRRMSQLINDILNYSRLEAGAGTTAKVPVDLNAVLTDIMEDLKIDITNKHATITSSVLPTVPAIEVQMHQLFYNLIANSLKFIAPQKSPLIQITAEKISHEEALNLGLPEDKSYCRLSFKDNGIGFEPQFAERIFTMFQRLHAKKDFEGTGIGLAICKKVVDNHQGLIFAQGKENEGACITTILPLS